METSLLEGLVGLLSWSAGMLFESGQAPGPAGHHHPLASPYGRFRASDGYLNIASGSQKMWEQLSTALGREDWISDDRFSDPARRVENRDLLTEEIERELASASVEDWVIRLNAAGIPSGPVYRLDQVFADPQVRARDMLVEMDHPVLGTYKTTGLPLKWSESVADPPRRPPLLAEHTRDILRELGIPESEIATLEQTGLVRQG